MYCQISQKVRQSDNEIWSVNRIQRENHAKNKAGSLVPGLFLFFKKALYEVKSTGQHLSFNMF